MTDQSTPSDTSVQTSPDAELVEAIDESIDWLVGGFINCTLAEGDRP